MFPASSSVLLFLATLFPKALCAGDAAAIAGQLSLTSSTVFPFPQQTTSAGANYIKDKWSLKGSISFGEKALAFVNDPIGGSGTRAVKRATNGLSVNTTASNSTRNTNSTTGTGNSGSGSGSVVLAVTYDAGTYSHGTGGADFYSIFGGGNDFEAMLLSYDIAFDSDFDWVKGGKLPGLKGGPKSNSCSGGNQPTGSDCFSSRLMWRKDGEGEVYVYMPQQQSLCNVDGIICNSDYGFSLGRGKFKFTAGQWQTVAVYAKMNSPPSESNGEIALYFNGAQAFSFNNLKFRTSDAVKAGGMYFSTFFGGNDKSWATPKTVHTYYRNFQLFGGSGGSSGNSSNSTSTSEASSNPSSTNSVSASSSSSSSSSASEPESTST